MKQIIKTCSMNSKRSLGIFRSFTVKFVTLSQPGKSGLISSENHFKAWKRKDSCGAILADPLRSGWSGSFCFFGWSGSFAPGGGGTRPIFGYR